MPPGYTATISLLSRNRVPWAALRQRQYQGRAFIPGVGNATDVHVISPKNLSTVANLQDVSSNGINNETLGTERAPSMMHRQPQSKT